ncbi:hypothetical protein [Rhodopirellula europaea]|uniref:hypothetical protein n=1 Tax=Rhodopirellula europaea TaxID=1263866 RepID=UPI003D2A8FC3
MKTSEANAVGATITSQLTRAIRDHLQDQDFSVEQGEVTIVDVDESTICFGLFPMDKQTGELKSEAEVIWSIEVFADLQGGR